MHTLSLAVCGCVALAADGTVLAQMPAPDWAGDPGVTSENFIFETAATELSGEWGALSVTIDSATNPVFGTGWQDPADNASISRANNGGAFDLGAAGNISVSLPLGPEAGGSYAIEYFVNFIYVAPPFYDPPQLSISGYSIDPMVAVTSGIESAGIYSWEGRTYSGTLSGISEESLMFVASTPGATNGAVVDTVQVYARVIPEPSTYAAIFGAAALAGAIVYRRRRREI